MRYNATDAGSAAMFDIVSDSVVFDTARFFADELGMFGKFREVADASSSWSSIYSGNISSWKGKVTDLYGKLG